MTETGNANCIAAYSEPRHVGTSCIGKQPESLEIRLIDESGQQVQKGEAGELLVRAGGEEPKRGFFSGYYKNETATQEAWDGGWLHTGDIVRQSEDGSFHFVDRLKNVIRRSGENISALEVEATLSLCTDVAHVGVSAVPDEIRGDEVLASVVIKKSSIANQETAEQIFADAKSALAYFKLPGYVAFVDELPLTPSNKPQRAELKKMGRRLVANLENETLCFDLRSMKKK